MYLLGAVLNEFFELLKTFHNFQTHFKHITAAYVNHSINLYTHKKTL